MSAQELRRVQVNSALRNLAQFSLHPEEFKTRSVPRLEFHQNIHVTPRRKIIPQDRAKERELSNVVFPAEFSDGFFGSRESILAD